MNLQTWHQTIAILWSFLEISTTIQLFLLSIIVVSCGLAYEIWMRAVRLSTLDKLSLKTIEKKHPHLPSLRTILITLFCCVTLLVVAIHAFIGSAPFNRPNEWVMLGTFFVLFGSLGMLSETKWKRAGDDMFSVIIGTSFAFLFLIITGSMAHPGHEQLAALLSGGLFLCIGLSWSVMQHIWTQRVRVIVLSVFLLWIFLLRFL